MRNRCNSSLVPGHELLSTRKDHCQGAPPPCSIHWKISQRSKNGCFLSVSFAYEICSRWNPLIQTWFDAWCFAWSNVYWSQQKSFTGCLMSSPPCLAVVLYVQWIAEEKSSWVKALEMSIEPTRIQKNDSKGFRSLKAMLAPQFRGRGSELLQPRWFRCVREMRASSNSNVFILAVIALLPVVWVAE